MPTRLCAWSCRANTCAHLSSHNRKPSSLNHHRGRRRGRRAGLAADRGAPPANARPRRPRRTFVSRASPSQSTPRPATIYQQASKPPQAARRYLPVCLPWRQLRSSCASSAAPQAVARGASLQASRCMPNWCIRAASLLGPRAAPSRRALGSRATACTPRAAGHAAASGRAAAAASGSAAAGAGQVRASLLRVRGRRRRGSDGRARARGLERRSSGWREAAKRRCRPASGPARASSRRDV